MSAKSKVIKSLSTFNARAFSSHHPEIMCITCIDGREKGGGHFDYGDEAIRITEIAAIIPPYKNAPVNTRAKFGFRHLKGVSTIIISGHSFCGGAQTVIHCPDPAMASTDDVRTIVESIAASGEDLVRLRDSFMKVSEGNTDMAANLLSRHLVLVSLRNISEYPYVDEQIRAKNLDVFPIYHVLKQSTGLKSHLERYDVAASVRPDASSIPEEMEAPCRSGRRALAYSRTSPPRTPSPKRSNLNLLLFIGLETGLVSFRPTLATGFSGGDGLSLIPGAFSRTGQCHWKSSLFCSRLALISRDKFISSQYHRGTRKNSRKRQMWTSLKSFPAS